MREWPLKRTPNRHFEPREPSFPFKSAAAILWLFKTQDSAVGNSCNQEAQDLRNCWIGQSLSDHGWRRSAEALMQVFCFHRPCIGASARATQPVSSTKHRKNGL